MKEIRRGARVKGVVVQVKDDELLVDIGGKSEGVLDVYKRQGIKRKFLLR